VNDTPLHICARNNHSKICEILIRNGAEIDTKGHDGRTPLFVAIRNGSDECVSVLLENGAITNELNTMGYTPLYYALWDEHWSIVKLMVIRGVDMHFVPSSSQVKKTVWDSALDMRLWEFEGEKKEVFEVMCQIEYERIISAFTSSPLVKECELLSDLCDMICHPFKFW